MNDTVQIPRFRSARRLVEWMERNWYRWVSEGQRPRLPPDRERVFLRTKKERPEEVAACVARYSGWAGRLSPEVEEVLRPHRDSLVAYLKNVHHVGDEIPLRLLDDLKGDNRSMWRVAKSIGRLPEHLEDTMGEGEAKYAFLYAKEVLRGRLPRHLEDVFFKDVHHAAKYAFEVIRGFSSVKLPDELHAFMVMKSFENPEDEDIRAYMDASESDPSKVGNTTNKV